MQKSRYNGSESVCKDGGKGLGPVVQNLTKLLANITLKFLS